MITILALLFAAVIVSIWTYRQFTVLRLYRKKRLDRDYEWSSETGFWGRR